MRPHEKVSLGANPIFAHREARRQDHRRTRDSTFRAGIFLFALIVVFGDFVGTPPMAALVAVMIMVAIGAFDRRSVKPPTLKRSRRAGHS